MSSALFGAPMLFDLWSLGGRAGHATISHGLDIVGCADQSCEVHAYGFPDTSSSKSAPFHYFGDLTGGAKHSGIVNLE
eukprot:6106058-Amphidinium_carterae.1